MSKKAIVALLWAGSIIATALVTYYGGAYYQQYMRIRQIAERTGMSVQQVQQQFAQSGEQGGQGGQGFWRGGGFMMGGQGGGQRSITGRVDSVDDGVITITTPRGAEKISVPGGVTVTKAVPGSISDIKPGQQIWVEGKRTSDGGFEASILAQVK